MDIQLSKQGDAMVVTLKGRMEAAGSALFEQQCRQLIGQGTLRIIADMGGLEQISSAGLRSILLVSKQLADKGGKLLLYNLDGVVKEVFDLSGFSAWEMADGKWVEKKST